jgi:malonyl-CoA O-methyltransferase
MSIALDAVLPERAAARRAFERARDFDSSCFVHDEARARLVERLDLVRLDARTIVDLGCASGRSAAALAQRYPGARVLAVDAAGAMLKAARASACPAALVRADVERLPLRDASVDLAFANLVLPWCRPQALFAEAARVLRANGALLFSTLGPDTLGELRGAFASADRAIHVHAAFDLHDLGDWAASAGLAEPVVDVDRIEVTYASVRNLVRDLRGVGAINVAAGRRRTLTGPRRWAAFERALGGERERFAVTVELVLGLAWGAGLGASKRGPSAEITIPIGEIRRPSGST